MDKLDAMSDMHDEGVRRHKSKNRLGHSPSDAVVVEMAALDKTHCTLMLYAAGTTLHQTSESALLNVTAAYFGFRAMRN